MSLDTLTPDERRERRQMDDSYYADERRAYLKELAERPAKLAREDRERLEWFSKRCNATRSEFENEVWHVKRAGRVPPAEILYDGGHDPEGYGDHIETPLEKQERLGRDLD